MEGWRIAMWMAVWAFCWRGDHQIQGVIGQGIHPLGGAGDDFVFVFHREGRIFDRLGSARLIAEFGVQFGIVILR